MSSVFATTTAGTLGVSVGTPGYNIATTGLAPLTTSDGYYIFRFHTSGTMSISGITTKRGPAQLQIMCVGGGSSGCSGSYANGGGLGGSGGGFLESTLSLSQAQTINITVGNGGSSAYSASAFLANNGENTTVSFSTNSEYNMIAYGGTGTMSGAPTANAPGTTVSGFPGCGGGGGAGGVGSNGTYQVGGNGGPGKKPTKPGISTAYPTTYWGGGGGGDSGYSNAGYGGLGGGGTGSDAQGGKLQGANGYGGTAIRSKDAQTNSGSGGGGVSPSSGGSGIGGSGIVMIAVKIPTYEAPPAPIINTNAPNFLTTNNDSIGQQYACVSMSSSGKYILANAAFTVTSGYLYLSTNFGTNFTIINSFTGKYNKSSAISSTGQYMVVVQGSSYMYRSGDYGASWQQVTNLSATQNWVSVALSKDGKYCLANGNSPTNSFYVSVNFDTATPTFTPISIYTTMNSSPYYNAISSLGQYMIQLCWGSTLTDGIAISTNYGTSFTKLTLSSIGITGANNYNFSCVAMTPDSTNVYISCYSNGLYKSTNLFSGSPTFTKITSATFTEQTWSGVVVSTDGTYIVASTDTKTYYSTNSGATWTVCYTGTVPYYMAMSDDAKYVIGLPISSTSKLLLSST